MSNEAFHLGFALLALAIVLAYFAVESFRMWLADYRERKFVREVNEAMERSEAHAKELQRRIDEAYRHSLPPDPEAVIRAERLVKAGALEPQGNVLYGWTIVRPETLNEVGTITNEAWAGASVASQRRRVERAEQRRRNEEARRQLDAVDFNRTRPSYQHELFPGGGPPDPVQHYSPASASAARDVPFVSSGGGSFDGGGSSGSYGSSCSSSSASSGGYSSSSFSSSSSDSGSSSSSDSGSSGSD